MKIPHARIDFIKAVLKAVFFCSAFTALFAGLSFFKFFLPLVGERMAYGILGLIAALVTTFAFMKFDEASWNDIGMKWDRNTFRKFFGGIVIGLLLMGVMVFIFLLFSGTKM